MVEERGRPARFYAAYNNHPLHPRNLITYLEPGMTPEERVRRMREYTRAVGELLASDQNVSSAWLLGSLARMEKYPFDADITIITNSLHHKSPRASFKTENVVIEPIEPHMKSGEFLEEDTCQRIDRLAKEYGTYTDINLLTQNQFDKNILEFQDSIRSEGIQLCPNTER
jgi:predicted nucleotidyltransferase